MNPYDEDAVADAIAVAWAAVAKEDKEQHVRAGLRFIYISVPTQQTPEQLNPNNKFGRLLICICM